jgi:hypothetical protein
LVHQVDGVGGVSDQWSGFILIYATTPHQTDTWAWWSNQQLTSAIGLPHAVGTCGLIILFGQKTV